MAKKGAAAMFGGTMPMMPGAGMGGKKKGKKKPPMKKGKKGKMPFGKK